MQGVRKPYQRAMASLEISQRQMCPYLPLQGHKLIDSAQLSIHLFSMMAMQASKQDGRMVSVYQLKEELEICGQN